MKEVMQYNSSLDNPSSSNTYKHYRCFKCRELGHIIKFCPNDKKKTPKRRMEGIEATKPSVMITYPESIHFSTTCMIKNTDLTTWDEIWYVSNKQTDIVFTTLMLLHRQRKLTVTIGESKKFLFSYGLGEVLIEQGGKNNLIIPGVHYTPEVTLNTLSLELLEKQGIDVNFDGNKCTLTPMKAGSKHSQKSKGSLLNKVQTFIEFGYFYNLIKNDDIISQEWDYFRDRFNKLVKWFFNHYLERSLPGSLPPIVNGVEIHLFDLYKLIENLGGYLSVHFSQDFDKVGEIMGLPKGYGEEIRRCYMNYLEILTSHFKTAKAPSKAQTGDLLEPAWRAEIDNGSLVHPPTHQDQPKQRESTLLEKHRNSLPVPSAFKDKEEHAQIQLVMTSQSSLKSIPSTYDHNLGFLHKSYQNQDRDSSTVPKNQDRDSSTVPKKQDRDSSTVPLKQDGDLSRFPKKQDGDSSTVPNMGKGQSVVELDRSGVRFSPMCDAKWPMAMEIKYEGVMCFPKSWVKPTFKMPILRIHDHSELFIRNLIIYEQSSEVQTCVTSYMNALDFLIDTPEDVAKLVKSRVLVNYLGSDEEAAGMINNICKEVPITDFYYKEEWNVLDKYYKAYWPNIIIAGLRHKYFGNPWSIIALIAGIVLFILTVIQTTYTVKAA
ncbi:ARID DNA-binding domain-containing protein [Tanacetum coccineum]